MATRSFVNAALLLDGQFVSGKRLTVANGRIASIDKNDGSCTGECVDCGGRLLFPGFIDAQVNGGSGVLFNAEPTVRGLRTIAETFRPSGTTSLLPTFISDRLDKIPIAIAAVQQAIAEGAPGIIGIHLEGPFLNEQRKGAHHAAFFCDLDEAALDLVSGLNNGVTLLTLAPERTTPEGIAALARRGVIVAAGHSDADAGTVRRAAQAGLTGFTHLFNAMSPLAAREPGCVGAALDLDQCWCGIITDGHHVADEVLRLAWRCKGRDKLILVTDAVPVVGMPDGSSFRMGGHAVHLENGVCRNDEGVLSGSVLTMREAVLGAVERMGTTLADAITMASETPARFLGIEKERGRIAPGLRADLIVADENLERMDVWIGGERI
jgi:N-acetylglucosamine-6-phosphate deacetylase